MKRGLVVGKFYPFHEGHAFLIRKAIEGSDEVTVLVCDRSDQLVSARERAQWIKQSFPAIRVMVIPDIGHDDDSRMWADYTVHALGFHPDVVFTSEDYGEAYARFMGARHVMVDRTRNTVPISGTKIRDDVFAQWRYLSPGAKAKFVKRVVLVGPESTGKTTLARNLAVHFKTAWVPEYGRFLSEGKFPSDAKWMMKEFEYIADAQNRLEDALAFSANRVLVCDTDSWATGIWHKRYMGDRSNRTDAYARGRRRDLYLLTAPDVPFVNDGLRDGEHLRDEMFSWFKESLEAEGLPFVVLSGSYAQRFDRAKEEIEALIKNAKNPFSGFPDRIVEIA